MGNVYISGIAFFWFAFCVAVEWRRWRSGRNSKGTTTTLVTFPPITLLYLVLFLQDIDDVRRSKLSEAFVRDALTTLEAGETPPLSDHAFDSTRASIEETRGRDLNTNVRIDDAYIFREIFRCNVILPGKGEIDVSVEDIRYMGWGWIRGFNAPGFRLKSFEFKEHTAQM
ncbi:MAG: hypothetical protein AMXMBFR84_03300 [Candidatus Hydrogenedentota bacterium]